MSEVKQRGKPEKDIKSQLISIRLDPEIIQSLDNIAESESSKTGYNLDRSQAIRRALIEFITRYESSADDR